MSSILLLLVTLQVAIAGSHCDWRRNSDLSKKLDKAVEDLRAVGVIYKDLKPENVILTADGEIKLIDRDNNI